MPSPIRPNPNAQAIDTQMRQAVASPMASQTLKTDLLRLNSAKASHDTTVIAAATKNLINDELSSGVAFKGSDGNPLSGKDVQSAIGDVVALESTSNKGLTVSGVAEQPTTAQPGDYSPG